MATDASGGHRDTRRRARWVVYLSILVLNLAQQPGRITFDTKLDLQMAPGAFLARSLHLWNPDSALGDLQNQASGYLFPLGPLYYLGHLLHVPMWIWERGVSALLMLLAFEGMRRLAAAWGGLGETSALLAGLFYMLSPRLLSTVGALTGEALPGAILPWTVLPLVLCLRGRLSVRRALLYSVATIPFMGGQNATEVLAALALPAVVLLVNGERWRTRARLFAGWSAGAVVVSLWWLLPLVMLGRYGSPFLDFVESAHNTTGRIGWLAALRGTDHWVMFLNLGDSTSWQAGHDLASSPALVASTAVAAVIGLTGLMSSRLPRRTSLVVALVIGLFLLTAGSEGPAGSVLGAPWTALLDGVLAPFRNVHKFDPVVRVPLALGFAAAAQHVLLHRSSRSPSRAHQLWIRPALVAVLVLPVMMASAPLFRGHLRDSDGFTGLPDSWHRAAAYLASRPGTVRSLVLPGSGFAVQTWGRTIDEPLQVLAANPWAARTQTPVMPAGTIRWLDQIEEEVAAGRPDPHFADLLARAGITHLVVRSDLDYANTDAPPPEVVHRLLDGAPGLTPVAQFGSSQTSYPAVQVYAVRPGGDDSRVRLLNAADAVSVLGGSEAVDQLLADDTVTDTRAMIRASGPAAGDADVLTDSMQRVERAFGGLHDVIGQVMTAADGYRTKRVVHDYLYDPASPTTVARYTDVSQVLSSSSKGYVDSFGGVRPEQGPAAAIDGSLLTGWVTSPYADPRGSWIELRFARPTVLGSTTLQFDVRNGARVRTVAMDTDSGRRTARVSPSGEVTGLGMETAPTRRARFTVQTASRTDRPVVLEDVRIAGVDMSRSLVVPGTVRSGTTVSVRSPVQRPACMPFNAGLACRAAYQRLSVESTGWARDLTVGEPGTWSVSGTVIAQGGEEIAALMAPLDPAQVQVSASSWYGGDPAAIPQNAFDGQVATTWVAAPSDDRPVLDLTWDRPRTISRILPRLAPGSPGRLPDRMIVESDGRTQEVTLGNVGAGLLEPVRTSHLRLTLIRRSSADELPVAVSELSIEGLEGRAYHADSRSATGTLCGFGPRIEVAGTQVETRVRGTIGDLLSGAPLTLEACGADTSVHLDPGTRRVEVQNTGGFAVRDLTLRPQGSRTTSYRASGVAVDAWGPSRRRVTVDTDRAALLAVTQSLNPGWVATLHGKSLQPVELDGWMQGWRLPAGSKGVIDLRFAPQVPYLVGLMAGLLLALGVIVSAVVVALRRRAGGTLLDDAPDRPLGRAGRLVFLVVLVLVSLPAAAGALVGLLGSARGVGPARRRAAVGLVVLAGLGAAVHALAHLATSIVAPATADALAAVAFGIMAGTVLVGMDEGGARDHG